MVAARLQHQRKAGHVAEARQCRWIEGKRGHLGNAHHQFRVEPLDDAGGLQFRCGALFPGLELHHHHAGIGCGRARHQIESGNRQHTFHAFLFHHHALNLTKCFGGPFAGRRFRKQRMHEERTLVFLGHETGRCDFGHRRQRHPKNGHDQYDPAETADTGGGNTSVAAGQAVKLAVEAVEEPVGQARIVGLHLGLQQNRTQGRGQGQSHQGGKHGRDSDGQRELLVQLSGDAGHEGHRHEHGRQYQSDGDHRTGHFLHGGMRGFTRAEVQRVHFVFDRFHHHDGVIDHDADGQHHAEQGQGIDREAEQLVDNERGNQRDRYGQHRNQRGAPALQEQKHHHQHQDQCLDEGMHHFLDRGFHELRSVVHDTVVKIFRERGLQAD